MPDAPSGRSQRSMRMPRPRRPILFYDGGCPLCSREVRHYRRLDRQGRVEWVDLTADQTRLLAYGIDPRDALARIHAVASDGRIVAGVRAFVVVWSELPYYRRLASLLRWEWALKPLDAVYEWFAGWRLRRRCAQDACLRG